MTPSQSWTEVVKGKRYRIATAKLLADDNYWDGNNFERQGRNTFLYRTPMGNYFTAHLSQFQGETDYIYPCTKQEAKDFYENLREKKCSYEEAFDEIPEDA